MLIEFTPPADMLDGRALRLLNLAADNLFGTIDGHVWLSRVELPKDPPMAPHRANASSASRNSAQVVAPRAGSQAREILAVLHGKVPMTAALITTLLDGRVSRNQVAARLWSLRKGGWVEYVKDDGGAPDDGLFVDAEGYWCNATGWRDGKVTHFARVQRLTVKAVRMLEANREAQQ